MPQLNPQNQSKTVTNVQENKLFRERLMDRFKPTQFVRVINLDDEPFQWQWMPDDGEEEMMDTDGLMRQVSGRKAFTNGYREQIDGNEQKWVINPGDSEVLLGSNAYLMIEGLYKKLVAKDKINQSPDQEATKARNFNWNDGKQQEEWIDKIFLGVEDPRFNEPARATEATSKTRN